MRARRIPVLVLLPATLLAGALAASGCTKAGDTTPGPGAAPTTAAPTSAPASTGEAPNPPPPNEPTAAGLEYRVSYNWGVPSSKVTIPHSVPPIAAPPSPPLPYLVAVYVGNHPEANPRYQRISFYFRGAFPEYNLQYVKSVLSEGKGDAIPLGGNAFLRIEFINAQAHDNAGAPTVKATPKNPIGFANLNSYGFAGDFEGHVTYGLGIKVAPNSDQVLPIRAGELKKPDGSGGFYYVVHFDVQNG
jgi:hypothetical protein